MRFEWDEDKARRNLAKHGVSFDRVREAFDDPNAITVSDRVVDGELRWRTLGRVGFVTILFVAHTYEDDETGTAVVRVISARRADRHERRSYERGDGHAFR